MSKNDRRKRMKTKHLKRILAIICIITMILPISSEVLAKITSSLEGTKQNFGISLMHKSKKLNGEEGIEFGYKIDNKNAYRIYAGSDNEEGYADTVLCLDQTGKFPKEDNTNTGEYTSLGEVTAEMFKDILQAEDFNKLQWLIKNALLPEDSSELRDQKLSKIFNGLMESTSDNENPVTLKEIKSVLTEDDIVFALQCVVWKITNKTTLGSLQGTTDNGATWDGIEGNDKWGYKGTKGAYIREIIKYYEANYTNYHNDPTDMVYTDPEFDTTIETKQEIVGAYAFIGPFKIKECNKYYSIDINFEDSTGKELSNVTYNLTDKASNQNVKVLPQTKEGLEGKEFYIRIRRTTAAKKVKFKLRTECYVLSSKGTVWATGKAEDQPLLTIKREEIPGEEITYEKEFDVKVEKQYDVSLRKYISQIKRQNENGTWKVIDLNQASTKRSPANQLIPATEEEPFNQYVYNHKKNPVEVQVGDRVVYTIRVTNECNEALIVKSITDYLPPSGIEYVSDDATYISEDNKWQYSSNRSAITTKTAGWALDPLHYAEVKIVCEVTEAAKGRVITNIAEITEIADENGKAITDIDSEPNNIKLPTTEKEWENYKGNEGTAPGGQTEPRYKNKDNLSDSGYYYKGQQDDDDFEKITVKTEESEVKIDLALRKSITHVNGKQVTPERVGKPDVWPLKDNNDSTTTADYSADKKTPPVEVNIGDVVTYKIRVFNEGQETAIASKIEDYIPEGLGFLPEHKGNIANGWVAVNGKLMKLNEIENAKVTNSDLEGATVDNANIITCSPSENNSESRACIRSEKLANTKIAAFDTDSNELNDENYLQIYCIVIGTEFEENEKVLRNIAAITEYQDENERVIPKDIDSEGKSINPNVFNPNDHEDDEDYDDVVLKRSKVIYDLALKKFISSVTSADGTSKTIPEEQKRRLQVLNVDALVNRSGNEKVDAQYGLNKTPVQIEDGDYITYTIRVFNEGDQAAIVKEIVDNVPEGLEFVTYEKNEDGSYKSGSKTNYTYGWETFKNQTTTTGWQEGIRTKYLQDKDTIPAFDRTKSNGTNKELGLSYVDVKVEFKVNLEKLDAATKASINKNGIKNIAEITDDDGDDNDSTTNNRVEIEDDIDYDIVIPTEFDLALRKFITKIDKKDITDREPAVSFTNGKITYTHKKTPETVKTGQIVTYTIRVYNEGSQDGYADEIKDNIPEGITFLPQHETNIEYEWKMYDKDGKETDDPSKAKTIKTNYLSKQKSQDNIIKAFDSTKNISDTNPSYKEVKVAFEVTKKSVTDGSKIIINTAEISNDAGKDGGEVKDKDSIPDNNQEDEDDIDKEYIEMKYFDLSLVKFVSKVIVTEDGVTKEIDTGYNGTENPEPVVKVEIDKKKLSRTNVKYVYSIKVTNEGEIEGYATEITDRIPAGLAFYEEDNSGYNWRIKEDGVITTDYLKDTLLKPGESAYIQVILRWENSEQNLGQKINIAEISADDNEYDMPDIDSTPNNNKDGEDDQDSAIIVLSIKTGSVQTYIILIITILGIFATGFYLIYKYVVKR